MSPKCLKTKPTVRALRPWDKIFPLFKDPLKCCFLHKTFPNKVEMGTICSQTSLVAVQSLSSVQLFATPWTAAHQTSLSFTISQSLLKLIATELVMPYNYLVLCHLLLLLPPIFPTIRVFSSESALRIKWPNYWSFSFSITPSNEYFWFRINWLDLPVIQGLSRVFSSTTIRNRWFFSTQTSL